MYSKKVLACSVKNLLLIDLGMAVAFSTIVIPVLRGLQHDRNPDEILHFTKEQSSWFGTYNEQTSRAIHHITRLLIFFQEVSSF